MVRGAVRPRRPAARPRLDLLSLDAEGVLKALGVEFKRDGDELWARCRSGLHKDKHPSWSMSTSAKRNTVFSCMSCKWAGNAITLVAKVKGCAPREAVEWLRQFARASSLPPEHFDAEVYEQNLGEPEPGPIGFRWRGRAFEPRAVAVGSPAQMYLAGRNIGPDYIRRHGIMDWSDARRLVVPVKRRGVMISWLARTYEGAKPKVLAPEGAPKRWEMFGLDYLNRELKEVNITEGWANVIRMEQAGVVNPLGLCGSNLTEFHVDELLFATKLVWWLDGDKAGELLGGASVQWLGRGRDNFVVPMPVGLDPAEFWPPARLLDFRPIPFREWARGRT